jgi:hypothetical protein
MSRRHTVYAPQPGSYDSNRANRAEEKVRALRRELAGAQRERDALLRLVDDVEQMAVDDGSGCTTCLRVVNACVSFAAMAKEDER